MSKTKNDKPRIIAWDIECTNLNADFGYILSASWMDLNGPREPKIVRIDGYKGFKTDRTNDKQLVRELAATLSEADIWVTWYGDRFDIPYVNTRLLWHELDLLPPIPSVDGWKAARNHLKLSSNRLANISEYLDVSRKTPVVGWEWVRAGAGHQEALDYVVDHNIKDVIVLGEVYDRIRPVIRNHPNVNLIEHSTTGKPTRSPCPVCSSDRVHSRGYHVAKTRRSVRYQCQACGSWFRGPSEAVQSPTLGKGADGKAKRKVKNVK